MHDDNVKSARLHALPDLDGDLVYYFIHAESGAWAVDADWSDEPAAVYDHMPTREDVLALHATYLRRMFAERVCVDMLLASRSDE